VVAGTAWHDTNLGRSLHVDPRLSRAGLPAGERSSDGRFTRFTGHRTDRLLVRGRRAERVRDFAIHLVVPMLVLELAVQLLILELADQLLAVKLLVVKLLVVELADQLLAVKLLAVQLL
jgi:hypothetical protein